MDLWWIPKTARTIEQDSIDATRPWKFLIGGARQDVSLKETSTNLLQHRRLPVEWRNLSRTIGYCHHCMQMSTVEVHHIFPLWVLSAEAVIREIQKYDQGDTEPRRIRGIVHSLAFVRDIEQQVSFVSWNTRENLAPLCGACHTRAEKKALRFFRETLQQQYAPFLYWDFESARKAYQEKK